MKKPASLISACFLFLVSSMQIVRVATQTNVVVNDGFSVPMGASVVAAIATLSLGIWLLNERKAP
jgi:hypothetical protein